MIYKINSKDNKYYICQDSYELRRIVTKLGDLFKSFSIIKKSKNTEIYEVVLRLPIRFKALLHQRKTELALKTMSTYLKMLIATECEDKVFKTLKNL